MKKNAKEIKEIEVIEAEPINVLETIKVSALIDVSSWKEKQLKLVAENTFFEITDNKTYEAGKKHRTNVVKGRTELQNQDKLVASKFATIRKEVGTETATLIEITQPLEDQWQEAVKAWEDRKANEKKLAEEAEALRIKTINDKIDETETSCYEIIQKMTFSEIEFSKTQLFAFFTVDFDFEEYDILFDQAKSRIEVALENKIASLTASENQRLDNIRLEEESKELKRLADLQAERLTAIMPYVAFGQVVDLTKLSELTKYEWELIFDAKKALFDADAKNMKEAQEKLNAENLEKENKAKADKEAIFEIRKKRLIEVGLICSETLKTFDYNNKVITFFAEVYNANTIEFENIISLAKKSIEEIKTKEIVIAEREKALSDIGMVVQDFGINFKVGENHFFTVEKYQIVNSTDEQFENMLKLAKEAFFQYRRSFIEMFGYKLNKENSMFEMEGFLPYPIENVLLPMTDFDYWLTTVKAQVDDVNEKLSIADAERLKKENKARIKKYASDKKTLTQFVNSLDVRNPIPELDNVESEETLNSFMIALEDFRKEWINNVEII